MSVSSCPSCREEVSLPGAASRDATVRCPMCQDEFELSSVYNNMPPELIVVNDPGGSVGGGESAGFTFGEGGDSIAAAGGGGAAPAFQFDESPAPSAAAGGEPTPASTSGRPQPRRQRAQKSPIWEVAKVVGGGVIGIIGALLIMWWGLKKDPLDFGPSVAKFAPWIVPAQFRGGAAASEEGDNVNNTVNQDTNTTNLAQANQGTPLGNPPFNANKKSNQEMFPDSLPDTSSDDSSDDTSDDTSTGNDFETTNTSDDGTDINSTPDNSPPPSNDPLITFRNPPFKATSDLLNAAEELRSAGSKWVKTSPRSETDNLHFYSMLAQFGETVTHVDRADPEVQTNAEKVKQMLSKFGAIDGSYEFIASRAQSWLDTTAAGRANTGICLAGTLVDLRKEKNGYVGQLQLATPSQPQLKFLCLNKPPAAIATDSKILVLGVVVEQPAEELDGYRGSDSELICCSLAISLEAPSAPPVNKPPETPPSPVSPPVDLPSIPIPSVPLPTIPVPSVDPSDDSG